MVKTSYLNPNLRVMTKVDSKRFGKGYDNANYEAFRKYSLQMTPGERPRETFCRWMDVVEEADQITLLSSDDPGKKPEQLTSDDINYPTEEELEEAFKVTTTKKNENMDDLDPTIQVDESQPQDESQFPITEFLPSSSSSAQRKRSTRSASDPLPKRFKYEDDFDLD